MYKPTEKLYTKETLSKHNSADALDYRLRFLFTSILRMSHRYWYTYPCIAEIETPPVAELTAEPANPAVTAWLLNERKW